MLSALGETHDYTGMTTATASLTVTMVTDLAMGRKGVRAWADKEQDCTTRWSK